VSEKKVLRKILGLRMAEVDRGFCLEILNGTHNIWGHGVDGMMM
jgi:hypothetical protein